jgi:hypothetical protein
VVAALRWWWLYNSSDCSGVVCSESGADLHIISVLKIVREKTHKYWDVTSPSPSLVFLLVPSVPIIPGGNWPPLSLPWSCLGGSCSCCCDALQAPHVAAVLIPVP